MFRRPGTLGQDPTRDPLPDITPGPLGHNDAYDPNRMGRINLRPRAHESLVALDRGVVPDAAEADKRLSFRLEATPLTKVPGAAAYNEVLRTFTFRFLHLIDLTRLKVRIGSPARGNVTVGFIQNVFKRRMECKYSGTGRHITKWVYEQPRLDSDSEAVAPWYAGKPFSESLDYREGAAVEVLYGDYPGGSYWNYYDNDEHKREELCYVNEEIDFGLWLAARATGDAADDWKNYSVIWSAKFTLWSKLNVIKPLSQLREEATKKGLIPYRSLGDPLYKFESDVRDFKENVAITPVLVGPTANDAQVDVAPREVYALGKVDDRLKKIKEEIEQAKKRVP